jgi:hypothetical protein
MTALSGWGAGQFTTELFERPRFSLRGNITKTIHVQIWNQLILHRPWAIVAKLCC